MSRPDLSPIDRVIAPLLEVHGVELVALEWFQGPGHGILRVTIDYPGGDPRHMDPSRGVSLARVTQLTRDLSTALDENDPIEQAYTLEVGSPGLERPLQKRADYDRFAGLVARVETRSAIAGRRTFTGTLRGTADAPAEAGGFVVRLVATTTGAEAYEVPAGLVARAKLLEVQGLPRAKPGQKGPSRRQERLAAREQARAINDAHRAKAARGEGARDGAPTAGEAREPGASADEAHAPKDLSREAPADASHEATAPRAEGVHEHSHEDRDQGRAGRRATER